MVVPGISSGMYENVLIPTDGSDYAERGVEHGLDIAERNDAAVHVVFVVDENIHGKTPALSGYEAFLEKVENEGQRIVDGVVERATDRGIEATGSVLRGRPDEMLVDYVDANDVDLVVMGKRGAAGVEPPHMGSVTERVISRTDVPVVPV